MGAEVVRAGAGRSGGARAHDGVGHAGGMVGLGSVPARCPGARGRVRGRAPLPVVVFAAPWWWRALVAVAVIVPLLGALAGSRAGRSSASRRGASVIVVTGSSLLVVGILTVWPSAFVPDGSDRQSSAVTATVILVLAWTAAEAGSLRPGPWGLLAGVLLSGLAGFAWYAAWCLYHRDDAGPVAFGWDGGPVVPWHAAVPLAVLVVLAPTLGWTIAAVGDRARDALRRHVHNPALTREVALFRR